MTAPAKVLTQEGFQNLMREREEKFDYPITWLRQIIITVRVRKDGVPIKKDRKIVCELSKAALSIEGAWMKCSEIHSSKKIVDRQSTWLEGRSSLLKRDIPEGTIVRLFILSIPHRDDVETVMFSLGMTRALVARRRGDFTEGQERHSDGDFCSFGCE